MLHNRDRGEAVGAPVAACLLGGGPCRSSVDYIMSLFASPPLWPLSSLLIPAHFYHVQKEVNPRGREPVGKLPGEAVAPPNLLVTKCKSCAQNGWFSRDIVKDLGI